MSNPTTAPRWPSVFVPVATPSGRKIHAVAVAGRWALRPAQSLRAALCCLVPDERLELVDVDTDRDEVCRICAAEIRRYVELEL